MNTGIIPAFWSGPLLSLLRIMTGLLFLAHGTGKLFGFPEVPMFAGIQVFSLFGVSGIIDLVGGILIVVGLFTRITAFVLAGFMAVAYFMVHAPMSFYPVLNNGEAAILFSFIYLYMAAAGGGPWSLDASRA